MSHTPSATPALALPRLRWLLPAALLAVATYALLAAFADIGAVGRALAQVPAWVPLAACGAALLHYALRWFRWHLYLRVFGHALPLRLDVLGYVSGFAFTATPGKAGEAARALYLKPLGVRYGETVGACLAERLTDLACVVAIAATGTFLYADFGWIVAVGVVLFAAAGFLLGSRGGLTRLLVAARRRSKGRLRHWLQRGQNAAAAVPALLRGRLLVSGLAIGTYGWLIEATGFWLLGQAAGIDVSWEQAICIYALGLLAGAVSFLPGGLVGTELVIVALLVRAGAPHDAAVATTLAARACTLWFAVLLGLLSIAVMHAPGGDAPVAAGPERN